MVDEVAVDESPARTNGLDSIKWWEADRGECHVGYSSRDNQLKERGVIDFAIGTERRYIKE